MAENYPELRRDLKKQTNALTKRVPKTVKAFNELHDTAMADGALSEKIKELIALGIAIADRCDACISFHVHEVLECGATEEEIAECVGVAVMMGGGPSLMYGAKAMDAVKQFQGERAEKPEVGDSDTMPRIPPD